MSHSSATVALFSEPTCRSPTHGSSTSYMLCRDAMRSSPLPKLFIWDATVDRSSRRSSLSLQAQVQASSQPHEAVPRVIDQRIGCLPRSGASALLRRAAGSLITDSWHSEGLPNPRYGRVSTVQSLTQERKTDNSGIDMVTAQKAAREVFDVPLTCLCLSPFVLLPSI